MDLKRLEKQINISINPKNSRKNKKRFNQEMELWNLVMAGSSKVSIFLISFMDLGSSFIMDRLFIKVDLIKDIFMAMENCKGTFSLII
jgi:hypothetical protein